MRKQMQSVVWKKLLITSVLSLLCQPVPAAAQQKTVIRLGTLLPRDTSYHHILQEMGNAWSQQTGGGVTLKIYLDGTMGSEQAMVQRMRVGQLQAATLSISGISEIDPSVSALQKMPLIFHTLEEAEYVRAKLAPELEKRLAEKGFVVLFWGDAGWVRYFSRVQALRPDDFKRMKVFVTSGDNDQVEIMKQIGMRPVPLEYADALPGLQTGIIDAVPDVPFHALAMQFYLVTRHMVEVNWVPLVGATVITKRTWDALPPAAREAMQRAAAQAGEKMQERSRAENDEAVAAMKKRGLQVHPMTPEIEQAWVQFCEAIYPKIRGKIVPADMFDEVRNLLAEYRSRRAVAASRTEHGAQSK